MASILKVDEMQGVASAGNITVTSEGGSATMHMQQGLCKAWAFVNGTDGSLRDSFNYSSATDNAGSGDYSYGYTNPMGNANFSGAAMANAGSNVGVTRGTNLTTGHDIFVFNTSNNSTNTASSFMIQGDLA
tara:strand:+ start:243 stop:635 length:393 start_codon:yes stop_codon:yes gene_type:complete